MRRSTFLWSSLLVAALAAVPVPAAAAEIDPADTVWVLVATALVLLMTPALAYFYGGLVHRKNVLSILMQCVTLMGVVSLQWVLWGYSLAFGPDVGGLVGSLDWLGLQGVGTAPSGTYATTIPHLLFAMFQGTFAIITPALIIGAYAERIRFSGFLLFSLLWATFVYDPLCHWVWGDGGWLAARGALDFAGGTVVHISSAMAALVMALRIGPRQGFPKEPKPPHNLTMTLLGVGLLWFGWFGFNAGSALGATEQAALAFATTHIGAAAGTVAWLVTDWLRHGKPTALGAGSGAVAGLVAITPAAGFVTPLGAIAIGGIAGVACNYAVTLRYRWGLDDALDVVGVHGVGGSVGAILTGLFCTAEYLVHDGQTFTRLEQLWAQVEGVLATYLFVGVVSWILAVVVDKLVGLRVAPEVEVAGLDLEEHGEVGYNLS